ncbi:MAG: CoA transferase [Acidobacteria bacterium]|nr:CoA transferase [Acidobacteriota bacterium]
MSANLPLDGVLVADFTRVLAGPLCSQLLADAGARVIKVEEPLRGDETRRWGPPFVDGVSAYFLSINRNKESLALDLKADGEIARKLIERADIVLDNFLPRQRVALLGDVRAINPRAVHCSISGFDSDTPDANTSGYDLLAQAGAGLMAITGEADGEPMKVGVALSDVLTAHHAFGAVCAALVARERTGEGASIEVSLFSATLASLVNVAQSALMRGNEAQRYGNAHPSIVPYQVFHGSDRAFALGAGTDRHYEQLCEQVLDRADLARDERFRTNAGRVQHREELVALLDAIFRQREAHEWVERCKHAAVPASLVQGVKEALESEAGRALVVETEHARIGRYRTVRNPVKLDGERLPVRSGAPELGQDTERILAELNARSRS